ncbi:M23 family metallopeptidase [Promineifilum sp.]|uniref:M23 family metallopeptidase n=1 Tax=Promineifilum sp. TaxID=2664178 RepID=UPI0035B19EE9
MTASPSPSLEATNAGSVVTTPAPPPTPTPLLTATPLSAGASADAPPCTPAPQLPCSPSTNDAAGATATTTPPPTFTPPPPPPPVEGEHLLLPRPVAAGGATWTDKSYPYGSTRGGTLRPHTGVEFGVPAGTPVLAVAPGAVVVAGDDSQIAYGPQTNFYGNLVIVEMSGLAGGSLYALYGHLSEIAVTAGQAVAVGDTLGLSGESGVADGPHLHFELRFGENSYGATRNPLLWLKPLKGTGVVAGRVLGPDGGRLNEAPVALLRVDGPAPYTATTSYAAGEPNPDDLLDETFVLDDVEPGYYQAVVDSGRRRYSTELWVFPDRVNWVEITLSPAAGSAAP